MFGNGRDLAISVALVVSVSSAIRMYFWNDSQKPDSLQQGIDELKAIMKDFRKMLNYRLIRVEVTVTNRLDEAHQQLAEAKVSRQNLANRLDEAEFSRQNLANRLDEVHQQLAEAKVSRQNLANRLDEVHQQLAEAKVSRQNLANRMDTVENGLNIATNERESIIELIKAIEAGLEKKFIPKHLHRKCYQQCYSKS